MAPVASAGTTQPANETMFMQLLVAQLRNQNPLDSPTDPTQFVSELAQFQQLEETTNTSQNVASILQILNQLVPQSGGTSSTGDTQS